MPADAEFIAGLHELRRTGRIHRFLEQAQRLLNTDANQPEIATLALRAATELGLGRPAQRLLNSRRDLPLDPQQRSELAATLGALPSGQIAWTTLRPMFVANAEALLSCRPQLSSAVPSLRESVRALELYKTSRGQWLLADRNTRIVNWRGALDTAEDEPSVKLPKRGAIGSAIIFGARHGGLIDEVYNRTRHVYLNFSRPLYIIEPDAARFAAWLHTGDQTRLLSDPRVFLFVGEAALKHFEEHLCENFRLSEANFVLNFLASHPMAADIRDCLDRIKVYRLARTNTLQEKLEQRYADRDAAYWHKRWNERGTVLGITSRYTTMLQYSMRDALHAYRNAGYKTELIIEEQDYELIHPAETLQRIADHDPDLILCIDHLRYEYPFLSRNLPFMCWVQDPMPNLESRKAGESIGPMDFMCGYYREPWMEKYGYPGDQYVFCPIPVSITMFESPAEPTSDAPENPYTADVCFVSHASQTVEMLYHQAMQNQPKHLHELLTLIYNRIVELLDAGGYLEWSVNADAFLDEILAEYGVKLATEHRDKIKSLYAYRLYDRGRRQQALGWVADWARRTNRTLKIYGKGWDVHPTLKEFAAGPIEHGEPLRQALQASTFALQLIPSGFRHQRALEALAAGALPLTRYCPVDFAGLPIEQFVSERAEGKHPEGIATLFPGLERIIFRSAEEFETIAEDLLANAEKRQSILNELRDVVKRDYSYAAVIRDIHQAFHDSLGRQAANAAAPEVAATAP